MQMADARNRAHAQVAAANAAAAAACVTQPRAVVEEFPVNHTLTKSARFGMEEQRAIKLEFEKRSELHMLSLAGFTSFMTEIVGVGADFCEHYFVAFDKGQCEIRRKALPPENLLKDADGFLRPPPLLVRESPSMTSRCGSLLLFASADVRPADGATWLTQVRLDR